MKILLIGGADVLVQAGCEEVELLMHLRGMERCRTCDPPHHPLRSPHVKGCWTIELLRE